jgi:hypothetical protein
MAGADRFPDPEKFEIRISGEASSRINPKQILNSNSQMFKPEPIRISAFGHLKIISSFACLREAASAKAGISCFEFKFLPYFFNPVMEMP